FKNGFAQRLGKIRVKTNGWYCDLSIHSRVVHFDVAILQTAVFFLSILKQNQRYGFQPFAV
ncbi:MAG: hypothetical protein JXB07_19710, partial [Anaerolineae bacterium]|nr:hypothetical protein [Anaerolineae bacterium]